MTDHPRRQRHVDGLINPHIYHRPQPRPKKSFKQRLFWLIPTLVVALVVGLVAAPTVRSFTRQVELLDLLSDGRYLVLFQNDAEIRPTGGFIGSFAIVETKNRTIKPLYFETNIYKLDDNYSQLKKIEPPKYLKAAIGDRGWGLRDSNVAASFDQSGPTILWFFEEEVKHLTGPKRLEIDKALNGNYQLDGVVATNLSTFLDVLEVTGPMKIPNHNVTVNQSNFFPLIQKHVERDYFEDPQNKITNEPKTILQDLMPVAISKLQNLPRTTQYKLLLELLKEKKVLVYARDIRKEQILLDQGWGGGLLLPESQQPKGQSDFLSIIRSSHAGNKSSFDIRPIYRYTVADAGSENLKAKIEVTFEHTGTGEWPSGVNHEYVRILAPTGAKFISGVSNGTDISKQIDLGRESGKSAFGFWIHTQPKSSQTVTLEYYIPRSTVLDTDYELSLIRQPGGNNPDVTVVYDGKALFQGKLTEDRLLKE